MKPFRILAVVASLTLLPMVIAAPAHAAAIARTWVSGVGDDANDCTRTAPCKTFAGAISKTTAGGTITVLDPGGYGTVTITKAITIDGGPAMASILAASTTGIIVAAGPGDDVILRNIDLIGEACNSIAGVRVTSARSVTLDHLRITGFPLGINALTTTPSSTLSITNSTIADSCTTGMNLAPTGAGSVTTVLAQSRVSSGGTGIKTAPNATFWAATSSIDSNRVAVDTSAGGTARVSCGVTLSGNATNGTVTSTQCSTGTVASSAAGQAPPAPVVRPPAGSGATRTWISGVGDDMNPCSRTAPCRTFAGAITKTVSSGSISVVDPVDGGAVTVSKAFTLDGSGTYAGVQTVSGSGIVVNAGPTDDVVLRNLSLDGNGCDGSTGILITGGRSLTLENVRIDGFQTGISYTGSATGSAPFSLSAHDLSITGACAAGINLTPATGHPVNATFDRTTILASGTALRAASGSVTWVAHSLLAGNGTGVVPATGTIHQSCGTDTIANGTNGSFSDNVCPRPEPITYCAVPKLTGKTLAQAIQSLKAAHCAVGPTKKKKGPKKKRGKVLSQNIPAGTQAKKGTKIALVLGK